MRKMEAAAAQQGRSVIYSSKSIAAGNSASEEDLQAVLHFISNLDGATPLARTGGELMEAGRINRAVSSFDGTLLCPSGHRRELVEKFFSIEASKGQSTLVRSNELKSRLNLQCARQEEVHGGIDAAGGQITGGNLDAEREGKKRADATEASTLDWSCHGDIAPTKSADGPAAQLVGRRSTLYNGPASRVKEEGLRQLVYSQELTVELRQAQSSRGTLEDCGAEGRDAKQRLATNASAHEEKVGNESKGTSGSETEYTKTPQLKQQWVHEGRSVETRDHRRAIRKSSTGRQRMPKQVEDRRRRPRSISAASERPPTGPQKQDSYPLFCMVDQPTQISKVPFMDKGQLDTLSRVHSARHAYTLVPSLFSSQVEEQEIVEAASSLHAFERTCTLQELMSLPRQSADIMTLRQVLSKPENGVQRGKSMEAPDSRMRRGSHNDSPVDTVCYCYVPNHVSTGSARYSPNTRRQSLKYKLQVCKILRRRNSCSSRKVESSTSFPTSTVSSSAANGRCSSGDKELNDCSQRTSVSRSAGMLSEQISSREEGKGDMGVQSNSASSWKSSPGTREQRTSLHERTLIDFPSILSAFQASKDRQRMHMSEVQHSGARFGDKPSSVRDTGCAACEALDFDMERRIRRLPLATSSPNSLRKQVEPARFQQKPSNRCQAARHETKGEGPQFDTRPKLCQGQGKTTDHIRQPFSSLSRLDLPWESQAADGHRVTFTSPFVEQLKGPEERVAHCVETCPTSGPAYWSSRHSSDPNYRIQNVEKFLQELHQNSCNCGHHHSNSQSPSDKEVLTRSNMHHRSRSRSLSPNLDRRVDKWKHYTDVGFFEGTVGLAVTSLRHFCACLINCRDDFINYESSSIAALLHDLLPEANFARAQDRHIGIQACLNDAIFHHFNEECYGLESESSGSQGIRFRKQVFLEKFHRLSSLFPEQGICMPHKQVRSGDLHEFYQFCRSKLITIQARMGLKIESWPRLLLHTFFEAMKQVLRVHTLAFSMEPPVNIVHIDKGSDFNHQYMELVDLNSMVGHFVPSARANWNFVPHIVKAKGQSADKPAPRIQRSSLEFDSKVEFMVMPGFELVNRIIKSQVYLQPKQY